VSGLWDQLRLVVIDIETCVAPDMAHRIVALGMAICRGGSIKQRYEWLVNPGCPVDAYTSKRVHLLTDAHLADEPTLDEILPDISRHLLAPAGERVVIAAHNAGFDVGWLRAEVSRVGAAALPDLPVLDTCGPILALAGLPLRRPKLGGLLEELGIANPAREHEALGDATAAANAAIALLQRAEAAGHADLDALLVAAGDATSASLPLRRSRPRSGKVRSVRAPEAPPSHVASHNQVLPAAPSPRQIAAWRGWIAECVGLRCDALVVRAAVAPESLQRGLLLDVLAHAAAAGDRASTATVLGALLPLLGNLPSTLGEMRRQGPPLTRIPGAGNRRGVALALHAWLQTTLRGIERCAADDPCPACREGQPCPLDTWRSALVPSALRPEESAVVAFWDTKGSGNAHAKGHGRGYLAMQRVAPDLADVVLRTCLAFHRTAGNAATADQIADQAWREAGCLDPAITEARAMVIARGGRRKDLDAAVKTCRKVLASRNESTDPAWASLAMRADQLEGRRSRLGSAAASRHHPLRPQRPARAPRFLRAS
jgi:DNA polymerase III epsilon subunit-like protein